MNKLMCIHFFGSAGIRGNNIKKHYSATPFLEATSSNLMLGKMTPALLTVRSNPEGIHRSADTAPRIIKSTFNQLHPVTVYKSDQPTWHLFFYYFLKYPFKILSAF